MIHEKSWRVVIATASGLLLVGCGGGSSDAAPEDPAATVTETVTASPSATPSATSTDAESASPTETQSPTPASSSEASTFGPYEASDAAGVTILDSAWDTSMGDGYATGGVIYYNNGPGVGEINVSVDLIDESGTTVASEQSGLYGRAAADSFGIMRITSTSSPPRTRIEVSDVSTEEDMDQPLVEGATATARVPEGGGQIPVTVTNHESMYDLKTTSYINFAFLDGSGALLSIEQGVLSKPVRAGATVDMFVSPFLIDVPRNASQVLASIQWGY